jgi:fatty acid desaturase
MGKVALLSVLLAGAVTWGAAAPVWALVPAQVAIAALLAHAVELVHQCLHQTGTGIPRVDRLLGVTLALPAGVSFHYYRYWHLYHHRHNGTDDDRESFGYGFDLLHSPRVSRRLAGIALHLSMAAHFYQTARRVTMALTTGLAADLRREAPDMKASDAARVRRDYLLLAGLIAAGAAWSLGAGTAVLVRVWLVPVLLWAPIHALIELPEHVLCDHPSEEENRNTRSIRAGWFMRWFTNGNCCHVGHHTDMRVPMHRLPELERALEARAPLAHTQPSYLTFYLRFARYLLTGRKF